MIARHGRVTKPQQPFYLTHVITPSVFMSTCVLLGLLVATCVFCPSYSCLWFSVSMSNSRDSTPTEIHMLRSL